MGQVFRSGSGMFKGLGAGLEQLFEGQHVEVVGMKLGAEKTRQAGWMGPGC